MIFHGLICCDIQSFFVKIEIQSFILWLYNFMVMVNILWFNTNHIKSKAVFKWVNGKATVLD
jgi:hypothetical protein